jgi:hypothetical protein
MPASKTSQKDRRALKITHRATQCNRNDDKEEEKKKELIQTLAYEKKKCAHHPRNKRIWFQRLISTTLTVYTCFDQTQR